VWSGVEWSRVKVYIEQDRQDAASERDAPRFFGVTTEHKTSRSSRQDEELSTVEAVCSQSEEFVERATDQTVGAGL
jgi:hypothetical protein